MSTLARPDRYGPPTPRKRGRRPRARYRGSLLALALAAACFGLGVAVGKAVAEGPSPGGTLSYERTLRPSTVRMPPRTITVTVRPE